MNHLKTTKLFSSAAAVLDQKSQADQRHRDHQPDQDPRHVPVGDAESTARQSQAQDQGQRRREGSAFGPFGTQCRSS